MNVLLLIFLLVLPLPAAAFQCIAGDVITDTPTCETEVQSCSTTTNQTNNALGSSYRWKAAKFVASDTATICKVRVKVGKVGSPSFNVKFSIYASTGTEPDESSVLGSTDNTNASSFSGEGVKTWTNFEGISAAISNGTEYWIVAEASALGDASNYVTIDTDTGCDYEEGILYSSNGTSWSTSDGGRGFRYYLYE